VASLSVLLFSRISQVAVADQLLELFHQLRDEAGVSCFLAESRWLRWDAGGAGAGFAFVTGAGKPMSS
jgi:hypothetical protein